MKKSPSTQMGFGSRSRSLRAFLAVLMMAGNPGFWLGLLCSAPIRIGLPVFVSSLLLTARLKAASLIGSHGRPSVITFNPETLSDDPTDVDLEQFHFFDEPLAPTSGTGMEGENGDLAQAIKASIGNPSDDALTPLQQFLKAHSRSRWVLAVGLGLGQVLYKRGYYSEAVDCFQTAWEAGKGETMNPAKGLADMALAELIRMYSRVGRMAEVESLLKETNTRTPQGKAARYYEDAREALWMMKNQPGVSFKCGPFGLQKILSFNQKDKSQDPLLMNAQSTQKGFCLYDLLKLSDQLGMNLQVAKRSPGAKVLVPALVHWKLGHYAALVEEKNGLYHAQDPTFGNDTWLSEKALDADASGYFLVPAGILPQGWQPVSDEEAKTVWGKGTTSGNQPQVNPCNGVSTSGCSACGDDGSGGNDNSPSDNGGPSPGDDSSTDPGTPQAGDDPGTSDSFINTAESSASGLFDFGMPKASIDPGLVALDLSDTPVGYKAPVGPSFYLRLNYNQRSATNSPEFGPNWSFNFFSYVEYDYSGQSSSNFNLYPRGGGQEPFTPGTTTPFSESIITASSGFTSGPTAGLPSSFTRQKRNGWTEIYDLPIVSADTVQLALTQIIDPHGNKMTIQYDSSYRITSITDALGQQTTFSYDGNGTLVTKVTDPFGRSASFQYDDQGRLISITDVLGLTSSFTYNSNPAYSSDWITQMTTPYGNTTVTYLDDEANAARELEIADPQGLKQHARFAQPQTPTDGTSPNEPAGINLDELWGDDRNTFYWDEKAMADAPLSPSSATVFHWLHSPAAQQTFYLESKKKPLENRVWYLYAGQNGVYSTDGMSNQPSVIARTALDANGVAQNQLSKFTYNQLGKMTGLTDSLGRAVTYIYASNELDLSQEKDGQGDVLASYTYNSQHEPLTKTDAAGKTWHYNYNSGGQLTAKTSPMGETTTYNYDSDGHLTSIVPPQPGTTVSFTYDNVGRVQTRTDAVLGTLTYSYDNADRVVQVSYPDGTNVTNNYNRLDLQSTEDRLGRITSYGYDADERVTSVTDPKGQVTQFGWCECGAMTSMTDPAGNETQWTRDVEGRVIAKNYPDGSSYSYAYDLGGGRLIQTIDPNKVKTIYNYNADDKLASVSYSSQNNGPATSSVSFEYDSVLGRLTSMTDGTGTTSYTYNNLQSGILGAGKLKSVQSPVGTSTANITYAYDADGRPVQQSIDGVAENYNFSNDQLVGATNSLGAFGYNYDSQSGRLTQINYPNGQKTQLDYYNSLNSGRLKDITNLAPNSTTLSKFSYNYDSDGEITNWVKQLGNATSSTQTLALSYDRASQICGGTTSFADGAPSQATTFTYDSAGNRTEETHTVGSVGSPQAGSFTHAFSTNNLNQLTNIIPNPLQLQFTVNQSSAVTVDGVGQTLNANSQYCTTVPPVTGNQTPVTVQAVSNNGRVKTQKYNILNTQPYTYDANGNLIQDDQKTYTWDGANRLIQVNLINAQPTTVADTIQMSYDGMGRRAGITELHGTTILTQKTFVWCGPQLCQERDVTGKTITKRFFAQGEQINGTNYYYTRDHLGSVRELTDSTGTVQGQYDYDFYGRQTQVVGTLCADFGYTGFYMNRSSGLDLTWYRAYDPEKGRWLSRDPLAEQAGINLYEYVNNNTIGLLDPLGLSSTAWEIGGGIAMLLGAALLFGPASAALISLLGLSSAEALWIGLALIAGGLLAETIGTFSSGVSECQAPAQNAAQKQNQQLQSENQDGITIPTYQTPEPTLNITVPNSQTPTP